MDIGPPGSMRLIDYFDKGVERAPARAFLIDGDVTRTYADSQAMSHRIANALHAAGVAPATKAAVLSGNSAPAFECVLGIIRSGCIWVPINGRNTIEDNTYVLNNTDAEVLFYASAFASLTHQLLAACPKIIRTICIDKDDAPAPSLARFVEGMPHDRSPEIVQTRETTVVLLSSGGTTGAPKGVMMPNRAWQTMIASTRTVSWMDDAIHLVAAPMTHAAGGSALVMSPMAATNVLLPAPDPLAVMQAIEKHRVTHLFLPPTVIYRLLAHPDVRSYDYSSLRYFTYASAPMAPAKIKEAMEVFGPCMTNSFGQSEAGLNITFFSPEDHVKVLQSGDERRLSSVGRATLFTRVEIMDDDGNLLPPETVGEIVMRGDQLMTGYYKNEEETAAANKHGWRHTGDLGFKDAEGWIFLVDRKRDMIITGGFNVFPAEIEKIILAHPAVQDCAVVGAPDEEWGERVTAVVELKSGQTATEAELLAFARQRLSGVKAPKAVQFVAELPRSPVGKLLRRKVREPFWVGRERMI
jgi:acyl-CoA synthetase (AMP-forming)/AMP-acid ligase II